MVYCITLQEETGAIVGSAQFKLSEKGVDCLGYQIRGKVYPACSPWELLDRVVQSFDLDTLTPKTKSNLLEIAAYTKS